MTNYSTSHLSVINENLNFRKFKKILRRTNLCLLQFHRSDGPIDADDAPRCVASLYDLKASTSSFAPLSQPLEPTLH